MFSSFTATTGVPRLRILIMLGNVDLDLGKCKNRGAYLIAVFSVASTNYMMISKRRRNIPSR